MKLAQIDKGNWEAHTKVEKYRSGADLSVDEPYEVVELHGNLLLNEGITRLLSLLAGGGGTVYDNTNARIGVGNSNTAATASQTALQGGSTLFKGMDATYPQRAGQTITFKATFVDAEANFPWEEHTVDNGAAANENLNRKVQSLGTKVSGSWVLTVSVTIS